MTTYNALKRLDVPTFPRAYRMQSNPDELSCQEGGTHPDVVSHKPRNTADKRGNICVIVVHVIHRHDNQELGCLVSRQK